MLGILQSISKPDLPHVTIAVIGGSQAGKTTFITSALDMRHPATSRTTTKKMSLDGSVYLVRLLEMSSREIVRDSKGPLWPRFGNDPSPPKVDGVLVLHDTTQPAIFSEIVNLLGVSTMSWTNTTIAYYYWGNVCLRSSQRYIPCSVAN